MAGVKVEKEARHRALYLAFRTLVGSGFMVRNLFLLLGLTDGASSLEMKKAYARLIQKLDAIQNEEVSKEQVACIVQEIRERLSDSFEYMKSLDAENQFSGTGCRPKLGQLLVACDMLSLEELDSVLEIQRNVLVDDTALGELLVAIGYVTEEQLAHFLRLQEVIKLPPDHPVRWGQRLVELGMITEDQLKIALIEHRATGVTLREALIERGWLSTELLDRIF